MGTRLGFIQENERFYKYSLEERVYALVFIKKLENEYNEDIYVEAQIKVI